MITIRKKLAEQAATKQEKEDRTSGGKELKRRQSFRSQILTSGRETGLPLFDSCYYRSWRVRRRHTKLVDNFLDYY